MTRQAQTQETAIRATVVIEAPIERAFAVFTEGIGSWFPPEYNLLAVNIAQRVFEPRVGEPCLRPRHRWHRVSLGAGAGVRTAPAGRHQLGYQSTVADRDRSREDERSRSAVHRGRRRIARAWSLNIAISSGTP